MGPPPSPRPTRWTGDAAVAPHDGVVAAHRRPDPGGDLAVSRLAYARFAAYALVVVVGSWGIWSVRDEIRQRERADDRAKVVEDYRDCLSTNDRRDELRHAFSTVLVDNLVAVAEEPPEPELVDRFRQGILDDLEREWPNIECERPPGAN